jgi:hypothetical protein
MKVSGAVESFSWAETFQLDRFKNMGMLYGAMHPTRGNVMSTTLPGSAPQVQSPSEKTEPAPAEKTVFFKPCFGITVQSSTLCVSVSAKPDTSPPSPSSCG